MLGELFRRIAWLVPLSFLVSLAAFLAFPPANDLSLSRFPAETAEDRLRAMFDELPTLFNPAPHDVTERTRIALERIEHGDADARAAAHEELARLGGAAFPSLFEALAERDAATRRDVGLALAPVAERMALPRASSAADPERTVQYWEDVWTARGTEFKTANVRTALSRLRRYGTATRLDEACALDTFVLPELFAELELPAAEDDLELARAYVEVLARVTARDDRVPQDASVDEARAVVLRWQRFWWLYEADYRTHDGASRARSTLTETRYAKWLALELMQAPVERRGEPPHLASRVETTLAFVTLGAFTSAVAGALARRFGRRRGNLGLDGIRLLPALPAIPPVLLAVLLQGSERPSVLLVALAIGAALALSVEPLAEAARPSETLYQAFGAAFTLDIVAGAGGLGTRARDAIIDRDAGLLTLALCLWFLTSSVGLVVVRVRSWLPRVARWPAAGLATAVALASLATRAPPGARPSPPAGFAPMEHTLLATAVATAVGALVYAIVLTRSRDLRGLGPFGEFAGLPAVLLGLLLSLASSPALPGTMLGATLIVAASALVHAERVRNALHQSDLYRASIAIGSDPTRFVQRHLRPRLTRALRSLVVLALGVTLGVEVGQRLLLPGSP